MRLNVGGNVNKAEDDAATSSSCMASIKGCKVRPGGVTRRERTQVESTDEPADAVEILQEEVAVEMNAIDIKPVNQVAKQKKLEMLQACRMTVMETLNQQKPLSQRCSVQHVESAVV